jgi:putative ABC transport system permease protein
MSLSETYAVGDGWCPACCLNTTFSIQEGVDAMFRDIQFGLKLLWKDRGYAATAILTLAVCIGANAAIFTIVYSVLLKPLPVPDSSRIVLMSNEYPNAGSTNGVLSSVPDYYDRLRAMTVYEEQAMYINTGLIVNINGSPELIAGLQGTPSLFRLLKVPVIQGRIFDDSEGEEGNDLKVILSYGLWQDLYGGNPNVIGQQIQMGSRARTIVGIMPRGFQFANPQARFYVPLTFSAEEKSDDSRHSNGWANIGRLKPGATLEQAQQQVNALNVANLERFPQYKSFLVNSAFHTRVERLQDVFVRNVRSMLYLLWGGAAFVLLIGVVNIANLTLARCNVRMKELSTRLAIGASRAQVARQLIIESLLLTLAGGLGGVLTGFGMLSALRTIGLDRLPRANEIQTDPTVIGATLAVAVILGTLIGLVAVAHLFKVNLSTVLYERTRTTTGGRRARTLRRVLVIAQVACAFVLLVGSGLLVASFRNLLAVDPGFKSDGVVTASVFMGRVNYPDDAAVRSFTNRLLENVRSIPGVTYAGATTSVPLGGDRSYNVIMAEGYTMKPGESMISPAHVTITPGYFEAMGVPLVRGRFFEKRDDASAPAVVIVDERLAQKFWPGADPIGKRMYVPQGPSELAGPNEHTLWLTVVGVVREVRLEDLTGRNGRGAYYFPAAQEVQRSLSLAIKTPADPGAVLTTLRTRLKELDPTMLLVNVRTMHEYATLSLVSRRTTMLLAISFAIVSLFLSAVGIYGVLSFLVTQRFREIGIRIAVGSTPLGIFVLILREGILLVAGGLALGFAATSALDEALQSQIYGLGTMDPIVMGLMIAILGLIALAACSLPARRATHVDPIAVLNQQ